MKKKLLSVLALSAIVLTGCGKSSGSSDNSGKGDSNVTPTPTVNLTWWNNYKQPSDDDKKKVTDGTMTQDALELKYSEYFYAQHIIEDFEKENPGVKVAQINPGNYNAIATQINAALTTHATPNIASTYQDNVYAYNSTPNTVLDMTPYITSTLEKDSDFNQGYLSIEKGIYGGKYLSLPYSKSAEMLVVNKSAFDLVGAGTAGVTATSTDTSSHSDQKYTAPTAVADKTAYAIPKTWDEMITTARKIKHDFPSLFENQYDEQGYFKAVPICWDSGQNMAISFLTNGGDLYTDGSKEGAAQILFNSETAKNMFVQLKKWNNEGLLCTQNQLPMDGPKYHIYGSAMFYQGQSFMNISSTAGASYFAADGFTASINHVPSYNGSSKVISQGPSLVFFEHGKKANDASFKFYQALTQKDNCAKLSSIDAYFPLRASAYDTNSIKEFTDLASKPIAADTETKTFSNKAKAYIGQAMNLNNTYSSNKEYFISDVFDHSAAARIAIGNLIDSLFNDKTLDTDEKIKAKVDELVAAAISSIYNA